MISMVWRISNSWFYTNSDYIFCFYVTRFRKARLSIAYNNANVKLIASHPGLDVGPDGGSAQSLEDLANDLIFAQLLYSPADPNEKLQMLKK